MGALYHLSGSTLDVSALGHEIPDPGIVNYYIEIINCPSGWICERTFAGGSWLFCYFLVFTLQLILKLSYCFCCKYPKHMELKCLNHLCCCDMSDLAPVARRVREKMEL